MTLLDSGRAIVTREHRREMQQMSSYDHVLEEILKLTPEERRRLRDDIAVPLATLPVRFHPPTNPTLPDGISPFVTFLENADPIRPEALDVMERVINEDLEVV